MHFCYQKIRYQKIINCGKGEGDKPSEDDAFAAMMELADNLLIKIAYIERELKMLFCGNRI